MRNNPNLFNLILKYKVIAKCSLQEAETWVENHFGEYVQYLSIRGKNTVPVETKEKYVIRELQFRGFVPAAGLKKKESCYYIYSKQPILGVTWILPIHGGHTDIQFKAGLPDVYLLHSMYGLPNWTRVGIDYKL